MATPHHRNASSGCFTAILRRILCKDGLPTHPSDDISELKPSDYDLHQKEHTATEAKPIHQAPATPGVVARLMGLESLPDTSLNRGPDSVLRSRSVNFMDYLLKFDLANQPPQQFHRRVRSSVSFRQVPVTAEVFALYVDNVGEKKKGRSKQRKSEVGSQQGKQEQSRHVRVKKDKVSKLKDEPRRVSVQRSGTCNGAKDFTPSKKEIYRKQAKAPAKLVSQKEAAIELESTRRKRNHRDSALVEKTEHDQCSSVDSSPISVLDFSIPHNRTRLAEEAVLDGKMKSTVKNEYQFPIPSFIPDVEGAIKKDKGFANQMELRTKLCRLAEKDIEESNWSSKDESEDMCVELGGQVLNQLLVQVVDELVLVTF